MGDIGKIFLDSQEHVYTLMQTDAFPRYLRSKLFLTWMFVFFLCGLSAIAVAPLF